ncbi:MAG: NAD(P)-binding protein [Firmicutes bacterium]|nr:NAD(P)-binding protein [Bacillota bacterium]
MDHFEQALAKMRTCYEKEAPFCADRCPFHLDVREFMLRLKRGSMNSAFRSFSNGVGFPGLVARLCPGYCEAACPRQKTDSPVRLHKLEEAVYRCASNTKPNSYNLPQKEGKFAIVGGGISGLGCALRLCNKKYQVTIFEATERVGGHVLQLLDPEEATSLMEREFIYEQYALRAGERITDPAALLKANGGEFDAVYIATGKGGDDFGLIPMEDGAIPCATNVPGLFLGGSLLGADTMHALAQGMTAATVLENYYKTGVVKSAPAIPPTKMVLDPSALEAKEGPEATEEGGGFTKAEAIEEAKRCIGCRCDACFRHCPMFKYFDKFPLRLAEEVRMTVYPVTLDHDGTVASRLISTCNQCGLCAEVCPLELDMGDLLLTAHQMMAVKESWPWPFHEFFIRDMEEANGCYGLVYRPQEEKDCDYVFYPGCQLGASDPRYVTAPYAYLKERMENLGLYLGCCGAPAIWAGDTKRQEQVHAEIRQNWEQLGKPCFILACPSCQQMFSKYLPEIPTASLYEILAEQGLQPPKQEGGQISVYDPCACRHQPELNARIRELSAAAGYENIPLRYEGQFAQCCSWGGQIALTNPPYSKWLANTRAHENELPYICYCSNCRDIFSRQGKESRHILDVLFDLNGWQRQAPRLDQRLANRAKLKQEFIPEEAGREYLKDSGLHLEIPTEMLEKLDQEYLLVEDLLQVILAAEASGKYLIDAESGSRLAHGMAGRMTLWAEYRPQEAGYVLLNAYGHRMHIASDYEPDATQSKRETPPESGLYCHSCNAALAEKKTHFGYLSYSFSANIQCCPVCGQVYIPESLVKGRIAQVEMTLEDK